MRAALLFVFASVCGLFMPFLPHTHTYTRIHPRVPGLLGIMNFTVMALGVTMSPLSHYFAVNKTNQIRSFEAERDGFRISGSRFSFRQLF